MPTTEINKNIYCQAQETNNMNKWMQSRKKTHTHQIMFNHLLFFSLLFFGYHIAVAAVSSDDAPKNGTHLKSKPISTGIATGFNTWRPTRTATRWCLSWHSQTANIWTMQCTRLPQVDYAWMVWRKCFMLLLLLLLVFCCCYENFPQITYDYRSKSKSFKLIPSFCGFIHTHGERVDMLFYYCSLHTTIINICLDEIFFCIRIRVLHYLLFELLKKTVETRLTNVLLVT